MDPKYSFQYSDKIALPWVVKNLKHFLFPDISKKGDRIQKSFQGVIATDEKKPVGLILSTFGDTQADARIHSLRVHPEYENQGIGTQLLHKLQVELANAGCRHIVGHFRSHWKSNESLVKMLTRAGWSDPREDLVIVKGKAARAVTVFTHDQVHLPDGYRFMPFADLTQEQEEYIRTRKREENWYDDILDPFLQARSMNATASIALMKEEQVVGWVISHLIAPHLNEYTSLFIDPAVRSFKLAHLLMRETMVRQANSEVSDFLITAKSDNSIMSRYVLRHAPPTDLFVTRSMHVEKHLNSES